MIAPLIEAGPEPRSRMKQGAVTCLVTVLLVFGTATAASWGEIDPDLERSVKAAFLYKFLGFVEWPAGLMRATEGPVIIGVVGADEIVAELEQILPGRHIDDRPVAVRKVQPSDSLVDVHLLFVGRAGERMLPGLAREAHRQSVLTVCESSRAVKSRCAINFVILDGRVRFEVSQEAAERSGLRLSSRLMAVALNAETSRP